jgi:ribosome-associated heat shock protein Hsp15
MRLDKVLWFLRLAPNRSLAQQWACAGHIRLNGRRIEKPSTAVAPGNILTLPLPARVQTIQILALPFRRGPAHEAQTFYRVLDGQADNHIAAHNEEAARGNAPP